MTSRRTVFLLAVALSFAACGARRPVLYPNEKMSAVGQAVADRDVDDCMRRAEQYVGSGGDSGGKAAGVAGSTAVGAGAGAAIGAVGGAVSGNAGQGAAVGAATGGTAGLLNGLFGLFGSRKQPDPVYASFVDRCLREKGYEPIGWK
jgi:Glycine-zipper domain